MSDVTCVGEYLSPIQAHDAAAALEAAGIEAEVWGAESAMASIAGWGGARVIVPTEAAERAVAVLAELADEANAERPPVSEQDLAREAAEAAPGSPEAEPHPGDDEDFVELVLDEVAEGERYARTTRTLAILGVALPLFAIVTIFRVASPPKRMRFSERATRRLGQSRLLAYLGIGLLALVLAARAFLAQR